MKDIKVDLADRSYRVIIGAGVLKETGTSLKEIGFGGRLVVITNPVVRELYGDGLKKSLVAEGFEVDILTVPDGEEYKSLDVAGGLYNELTAIYTERATPILALGGGVIGDLAGFVAATYLRGVPLIQMPTTLLAQVDSSIGGKVAVNHGQLKNKIGAFYQPWLVLSDTSVLKTLPPSEFANGMAEVIKSAVIRDKELFAFVEANIDKIMAQDEAALEEVIFRSAAIKARVVEQDEIDLGLRNILNFGHTVGHAIETVSDFGVGHGQAVAMGMVAAGEIARRKGVFEEEELLRLKGVIKAAGLPVEIPEMDARKLIEAMQHDKKIIGGRVRFVLSRAIGDVFITDEVDLSLVKEVLGG
ncbi:MAG TPA: 3-dehydroquinate synthase [Dehalococcoidia bacterium]|nr:3-dehydroquinate synthase [Dehalococcoidia bacterium]